MPLDLSVTLAATFISVALMTGWMASVLLSRNAPGRRRLSQLTAAAPAVPLTRLQVAEPSAALRRISKALPKSAKDLLRLRRRLSAAGWNQFSGAAIYSYSAAQLILLLVFALMPVLMLGFAAGWVLSLFTGFLGYITPDLILAHKIAQRKKAIQNGLPDALDLLVVCIEAGSSLDQAILKASEELQIGLPAIARELKTVAAEIRAGKPRLEAFQDLARRTGVDDVRTLVAILIQTDRYGTSIAQALRTHADTSRTKRRQRAEERASTVGVKLVFPLVLCLVPALYVVCLGPIIVRMYRAFL